MFQEKAIEVKGDPKGKKREVKRRNIEQRNRVSMSKERKEEHYTVQSIGVTVTS